MTPRAQLPERSAQSVGRRTLRRPIGTLLAITVSLTLVAQAVSLLNGWSVLPAQATELVLLLGGATLITAVGGGRADVRRLFGGLTKWRIGLPSIVLVVGTLPVLTVVVAATTGTLTRAPHGWIHLALLYTAFLLFGAVTANLWEETVWGGFVQGRLMARRGLLVGSLLTAVAAPSRRGGLRHFATDAASRRARVDLPRQTGALVETVSGSPDEEGMRSAARLLQEDDAPIGVAVSRV